jgi:hypothetical protein
LFCLISLRIATPPLRHPNLIAEINFVITNTASASPRADTAHLLSIPAQMPRRHLSVELIANDHLMFDGSSSAGANLSRALHFGTAGFRSFGELTEATAYSLGLFDPENTHGYRMCGKITSDEFSESFL